MFSIFHHASHVILRKSYASTRFNLNEPYYLSLSLALVLSLSLSCRCFRSSSSYLDSSPLLLLLALFASFRFSSFREKNEQKNIDAEDDDDDGEDGFEFICLSLVG